MGVVFDQRLVNFPQGEAKLGDRIREFLDQHPVGREMLRDAEWIEGDVHWRKNLAYHSRVFAGDGFALVGDAAAFLDPLYSPGMDVISFTSTATTALIVAQRRGEAMAPLIEKHNATFTQSYRRWFEAIYKDRNTEYHSRRVRPHATGVPPGSWPLLSGHRLATLQVRRQGAARRRPSPCRSRRRSIVSCAFTIPRFAAMARKRRERRVWGQGNSRQQYLFQSFSISPKDVPRIVVAAVALACRWSCGRGGGVGSAEAKPRRCGDSGRE